jgi:cell division protein FtsB
MKTQLANTIALAVALGMVITTAAQAQQSPPVPADLAEVVRRLEQQVGQLQATVSELRAESAKYRAEVADLRRQLPGASLPTAGERDDSQQQPGSANSDARLSKLEDEYSLLTGKVNEQYQTKVESASRYRIRMSGIVLLNLFSNQGAVDSVDMPAKALPSERGYGDASFGGTIRQSQLAFDVFGPMWHGARTSANLQLDFAGGFPATPDGVTLGIARLRTGTVRLDWPRTSVVAGQDTPFISPLSPTSLASIAQPALSYAGNLWTWTPQIRMEHRFALSEGSSIALQGGILDSLTGQPPQNSYYRLPDAGETSRQPAYAARIGWSKTHDDSAAAIGVGGYFGRQYWPYDQNVSAWAVTADWLVPVTNRVEVSGEFYRGRALGGLGGSGGQSVVVLGPVAGPASRYLGLDSLGGWAQMKFKPTSLWEVNAAFGQDNPYASQLRAGNTLPYSFYPVPSLRNRSWFTNFIYRPRSDLLLSLEYRRIHTFEISGDQTAGNVSASVGVLF